MHKLCCHFSSRELEEKDTVNHIIIINNNNNNTRLRQGHMFGRWFKLRGMSGALSGLFLSINRKLRVAGQPRPNHISNLIMSPWILQEALSSAHITISIAQVQQIYRGEHNIKPGAVNRIERDKCDYKYWRITGSSIRQGNRTQRLIKLNYRQANCYIFTSSPSLFFSFRCIP